MEPDEIRLPGSARFEELEVDLCPGASAVALDLGAREVQLDDGEAVGFDGLIVATGSAPRRLPGAEDAEGIFYLRTLDDALALRQAIATARRVAIVGAGFIGLEVASEARALGAEVTVVDVAPHPLARVFGPEVGARVRTLHEQHGVELLCDTEIAGIVVAEGRARGLELAHGSIEADVVLVAIGAEPRTGWLAGSGLELERGVVCDASLRAAPGVYAAGDVARWEHPLFGSIRVEHWTTAGEHARVAAKNLTAELGGDQPSAQADAVPYFWTDQHQVKIQLAGWVAGSDEVVEIEVDGRVGTLFGHEDRLVGALAYDWPAFIAKQRRAIAASSSLREAIDALNPDYSTLTKQVGTTKLES